MYGVGKSTLQLSHPDVQCPESYSDWLLDDDFMPQFTNACLFNYHPLPFFLPSFPTALSTLMSSHDPFRILIKTAIVRKKKQQVIFKSNKTYCNHTFDFKCYNDRALQCLLLLHCSGSFRSGVLTPSCASLSNPCLPSTTVMHCQKSTKTSVNL